MEATKLATALTSTLAPALRFLLTPHPNNEYNGEIVPHEAAEAYQSVWHKILNKAEEQSPLLQAAQTLAHNSKDSTALATFTQELRTILDTDSALFNDLKKELLHHFVYHHFDAVPAELRPVH